MSPLGWVNHDLVAATTLSNLHAHAKVEGVSISLVLHREEQEGATTTTSTVAPTTQRTKVENRTVVSSDKEPMPFKEVVEEYVGLPYHEVNLMIGKDIRARGERSVIEVYIKSKITVNQCYFR